MLKLLLGTDWVANRDAVLQMVADNVKSKNEGCILMVPELVSHDTERRICAVAGDTASRYAEVLSFTRLARRASETTGNTALQCLDNGGRVVAMASAARQLHSKLKAYAAVETRPEFLTALVDTIDEFKRCCISSVMLSDASKKASGNFAQKLEELALLLDAYESICANGKCDPRDQMTWLLEELEDSEFASNHIFYIDGFPDFTRQHMAILEHIICHSPNVVISMNCDRLDSDAMAFAKAGKTAGDIVRAAKKMGVQVEVQTVLPRENAVSKIAKHVFQGTPEAVLDKDILVVNRSESVYQECSAAAEQILDKIQSGARYRDIGVVCGDMTVYQNALSMVFRRFGIPVYISGTDDVLEKNAIAAIFSAIDAALSAFEQKKVLLYLRSLLSPLDEEVVDELENYALTWRIDSSRWVKVWTNHPDGLGAKWDDASQDTMKRLNDAREHALAPLVTLKENFDQAKNLGQQINALHIFFEQINLSEILCNLAQKMDLSGDNRNAQILSQLWQILNDALDQLNDMLGQTAWDSETFTRLLRLLLSQYDVGTIPTVLDAVTVGSVSAMRCQQTKHLFVLGALEGTLPCYTTGSDAILSDQERIMLKDLGVQLTGGALDGLQIEFSEIYEVLCGAEQSVFVSCPSGQPSFVYKRLLQMAGEETKGSFLAGTARKDPLDAAALLARHNAMEFAEELGVSDAYKRIEDGINYNIGAISSENVKGIYGNKLHLSASQIDRQAECRFSYFLKYGLRAKERKTAEIDPAEFGTYVHAVLEQTAKEVMQRGGFHAVTLEQTLELARQYSNEYANERFSELDAQRAVYLFGRNIHELEMIVSELWQELQDSSFHPDYFELSFGMDKQMPAIEIENDGMPANLRGFVDRVDLFNNDSGSYVRVVDYKTGKKDFDYCDVFNGIGLQMLLYLFALEQNGENFFGHSMIPAGVEYFPARAPLLIADSLLTDEQAMTERKKVWKRKGLLLSDETILQAMESTQPPVRMPYKCNKEGSLTGDIATAEQFRMLKDYVFKLLARFVEDIASGCVTPNPYTRGTSHSACQYCPYGSICNAEYVEGRRNYKAMSAERFWNEMEKEMSKDG